MTERGGSLLLAALDPSAPADLAAPADWRLSPVAEALSAARGEFTGGVDAQQPEAPTALPNEAWPAGRGWLALGWCLLLATAALVSERAAPPAVNLAEPAALPPPAPWPVTEESSGSLPNPPVAAVTNPQAAGAPAAAPPAAVARQPLLKRVIAPPSALIAAHAAYGRGDLAEARRRYGAALAQTPGQPDALLGLAAIADQSGRPAVARAAYAGVLALDPAQWAARAGLWSLTAGDGESDDATAGLLPPRNAEELARWEDALGRAAAAAGHWAQARAHFAEAVTAVPGAPDYAYALAVSLDQLGLPAAAAAAYRQAIELRASAPARFPVAAARARLAALAPDGGD